MLYRAQSEKARAGAAAACRLAGLAIELASACLTGMRRAEALLGRPRERRTTEHALFAAIGAAVAKEERPV